MYLLSSDFRASAFQLSILSEVCYLNFLWQCSYHPCSPMIPWLRRNMSDLAETYSCVAIEVEGCHNVMGCWNPWKSTGNKTWLVVLNIFVVSWFPSFPGVSWSNLTIAYFSNGVWFGKCLADFCCLVGFGWPHILRLSNLKSGEDEQHVLEKENNIVFRWVEIHKLPLM